MEGIIKRADGRYEVNCGGTVVAARQDDPDKASKRNASGRVYGFDGDTIEFGFRINGSKWRPCVSSIMSGEAGKMGSGYWKVRMEADVDEPVIVAEPV